MKIGDSSRCCEPRPLQSGRSFQETSLSFYQKTMGRLWKWGESEDLPLRQGYRFPEGKRQIARRRRTVRKDDGRFRFRKDNVLLAARGQHQEKRKEDKQSFHFYCLWINSDCFCSSRQKQRTSKHEKTGPVLSSCGVGFSDQ